MNSETPRTLEQLGFKKCEVGDDCYIQSSTELHLTSIGLTEAVKDQLEQELNRWKQGSKGLLELALAISNEYTDAADWVDDIGRIQKMARASLAQFNQPK